MKDATDARGIDVSSGVKKELPMRGYRKNTVDTINSEQKKRNHRRK